MHLINSTRMSVGYNVGMDPDGRELLVVAMKGTFTIPRSGESPAFTEEQVPLVMADIFAEVPGVGAPVHEVDFAPRKRACDILLVGHARAQRPVTRMQVALRVGSMEKSFDVLGDRVWRSGVTGIGGSDPAAFTTMPVSYDRAFGGTHVPDDPMGMHAVYDANPAGRGWHADLRHSSVHDRPLPNTERRDEPVVSPTGRYAPMAFGPIGRAWPQRARHAGTYDEHWRDDVFPFLPADFDDRYFQAAPVDQQIPIPDGPLEVLLAGFTVDGPRRFTLPHFEAPVYVRPKAGNVEFHRGLLDTIVFEPDHERLTLTWRVTRPLRRSIFDVAQVQVGHRDRTFWGRPVRASAGSPAELLAQPEAA